MINGSFMSWKKVRANPLVALKIILFILAASLVRHVPAMLAREMAPLPGLFSNAICNTFGFSFASSKSF